MEGAVNVGKGILELLYNTECFFLDTFYEKERSIKTAANFGSAVGGAIAAGYKLSEIAKRYVDKIARTGDYAQVGRDSNLLWHIACDSWNTLTEEQRSEKLGEVGASLGVF